MEYYDYNDNEWVESDKMKVIVLGGSSGGIGNQLTHILGRDYDVLGINSQAMDLTEINDVRLFLQNHDPEVIVNMAGVNFDGTVFNIKPENADRLIDVNYKGTINLLKAAIPLMVKKKFGRIILASSVLVKHRVYGTGIYASLKAAIETLVGVTALEVARHNITINCLRMGYMDAGLTYQIPEEFIQEIKMKIPKRSFGSIDNIANAVKFLINSDYVTGTSVEITGGL